MNGYICRTQDGTTGYFLRDGHGDIQTAYAEDRTTKLADYTYDAWGSQNNAESLSWGESNPIRYAGQYYDTESGMFYLRARYYNPDIGRFINEDPAKDGLNWFAYCGNNPVTRIDPNGENWITDNIATAWNSAKWAFNVAGDFANKTQKVAQRKFWKTGSKIILQDHFNYMTSAWMLEHSLQDNPSDIWRGNNSRIAYLVNNDSAYLSALDNAIKNAKDNRLDSYKISVQFNTGDLYYSIHKSDIYLTGYKRDDGKWIINAILKDSYDFTEVQSFMNDSGGWSNQASFGTAANDAAFVSQKTGAIQSYNITVDFWTTR